jgi:hypothetical protein
LALARERRRGELVDLAELPRAVAVADMAMQVIGALFLIDALPDTNLRRRY